MAIKKSLKSLMKEGHQENLPVHPSDAGVQIPDKFVKAESAPKSEGAESLLPTHPSDAAATLPDDRSKLQSHPSSAKPEVDGQAVANASAKHGNAEGVQIPDERSKLASNQGKVAEEKESEDEDKEEVKEAAEDEKKEKEEDEKELKEHLAALVRGEVLPDEFKDKAKTLFETAVKSSIERRATSTLKALTEKNAKELAEEKVRLSEQLIDKVDGYFDVIVEEWLTENAVAIESSLKTEICEEFILGLKGLFESHYIEVPETKEDILEKQNLKVEELEKALNESMNKVVELKKELSANRKDAALKDLSEGLSDAQTSKFKKLCENVLFENVDEFARKAAVIKTNYFPKEAPKVDASTETLIAEGGLKGESSDSNSGIQPLRLGEALSKLVKR